MSFDPAQLEDRAHQLQDAYQTAVSARRRPPNSPFGSWGPTPQAPDVTDIYDDFLSLPDPAAFTPVTDAIKGAMDGLSSQGFLDDPAKQGAAAANFSNPTLSNIATTGDYFDEWTGDAAQQFKSAYASKFEAVVSNQFTLASTLRYAVNAEAAIWQAARDDLDKLSAAAIDKVRHANDCDGAAFAAALGVLGAVVTLPFTGGAGLEIGLGAIAAGATVAGSGITAGAAGARQTSPDENGLSGHSPEEIIASLRTRLTDIRTQIHDAELKIADVLVRNEMTVLTEWDRLQLPAPAIASATPQNVDSQEFGGHVA